MFAGSFDHAAPGRLECARVAVVSPCSARRFLPQDGRHIDDDCLIPIGNPPVDRSPFSCDGPGLRATGACSSSAGNGSFSAGTTEPSSSIRFPPADAREDARLERLQVIALTRARRLRQRGPVSVTLTGRCRTIPGVQIDEIRRIARACRRDRQAARFQNRGRTSAPAVALAGAGESCRFSNRLRLERGKGLRV